VASGDPHGRQILPGGDSITDVELTLLTSAVFVGLMIGSIVWGVVADSYGRRMGFFATSVFCLVFGGCPLYIRDSLFARC
jgi:MFS family permease